MDDKEKQYLIVVSSWATAEEYKKILREIGTPEDALELIKLLEERRKVWEWNKGGIQRIKIVFYWLLGLGALATALTALRAAYEWLNPYIIP